MAINQKKIRRWKNCDNFIEFFTISLIFQWISGGLFAYLCCSASALTSHRCYIKVFFSSLFFWISNVVFVEFLFISELFKVEKFFLFVSFSVYVLSNKKRRKFTWTFLPIVKSWCDFFPLFVCAKHCWI